MEADLHYMPRAVVNAVEMTVRAPSTMEDQKAKVHEDKHEAHSRLRPPHWPRHVRQLAEGDREPRRNAITVGWPQAKLLDEFK